MYTALIVLGSLVVGAFVGLWALSLVFKYGVRWPRS